MAFAWLGVPTAHAAGSEWVRASAGKTEVVSDAGSGVAERALRYLLDIRAVFASSPALADGAPLPVRMILFRREADFAPYRTSPLTKGFYQSSPERDYIVTFNNPNKLRRTIYHESTHLVLNHSSVVLPCWMEEGTAEFYSTLEARDGKLILGRPIEEHLEALKTLKWLDGDELWSVTPNSMYYNEASHVGIFYAESWALVHMLQSDARYRDHLPDFAAQMSAGTPAREAFANAFGQPLDRILPELRRYVAVGRFPVSEVPFPDTSAAPAIHSAPINDQEAQIELSELARYVGKDDLSREILKDLGKNGADSSVLETARGLVALRDSDYGEAEKRLARAIELGTQRAEVYFEYAMLLRDRGDGREQVEKLLRKAVQLNPRYAEAQFLLGLMAEDKSRHEEAVEHFRAATEVLPRQSSFWHALALAYHELGQQDRARHAALLSLRTANSPYEEDRARAALQLIATKAPTPPAVRPEVVVPESWNPPRGDTTIEGTLIQVTCGGSQPVLAVRTEQGTWTLTVSNPNNVRIRNSGTAQRELSCGAQDAVPVVAEFRTVNKEARTGDLVAIEFR